MIYDCHYFRPGREDFKKHITAAMPKLLAEPGGGTQGGPAGKTEGKTTEAKMIEVEVSPPSHEPTPGRPVPPMYEEGEGPSENLEGALAALKGVTGKANEDCVAKAVELIEKAKGWYDGHVLREPEVARAYGRTNRSPGGGRQRVGVAGAPF